MKTLSLTLALDVEEGVTATARSLYAPERGTLSFVQEAGWDPEQVLTAEEISPSAGFDSRTIQPLAYAIPIISLTSTDPHNLRLYGVVRG